MLFSAFHLGRDPFGRQQPVIERTSRAGPQQLQSSSCQSSIQAHPLFPVSKRYVCDDEGSTLGRTSSKFYLDPGNEWPPPSCVSLAPHRRTPAKRRQYNPSLRLVITCFRLSFVRQAGAGIKRPLDSRSIRNSLHKINMSRANSISAITFLALESSLG